MMVDVLCILEDRYWASMDVPCSIVSNNPYSEDVECLVSIMRAFFWQGKGNYCGCPIIRQLLLVNG